MIIVATIEQRVILPYRQIDDYTTAPYVYATLLSENQTLLFNNVTGKFEIKTLSILGHSHTFSSITDKPTTIGGYGITNAYTKTEVNNIFGGYYTKTEIDQMMGGITVDAYTKSEIQNFFGGSVAISGYNKNNWDTAYGWGSHSGVYLPLTGGILTGTLTGTIGNFQQLSASTSLTLSGRVLTIRTL